MDGSTEVHYHFHLGCSMDRSMEVPFDCSSLGCLMDGSTEVHLDHSWSFDWVAQWIARWKFTWIATGK